jgi:hypothetical protein
MPDEDLHMTSGIKRPALYCRKRVYLYAITNLTFGPRPSGGFSRLRLDRKTFGQNPH